MSAHDATDAATIGPVASTPAKFSRRGAGRTDVESPIEEHEDAAKAELKKQLETANQSLEEGQGADDSDDDRRRPGAANSKEVWWVGGATCGLQG